MTRDEIIKALDWHAPSVESGSQSLLRRIEKLVAMAEAAEREACAKVAESPVGKYEVTVACGTDPAPHRIPRYLEWDSIAAAIRARGSK